MGRGVELAFLNQIYEISSANILNNLNLLLMQLLLIACAPSEDSHHENTPI